MNYLTLLGTLAAGLLATCPAPAQILAVSGSGSSFNVAAGTVVSVTGGAVAVASGGTLNNAGTLTFTGDLSNAGTLGPGTGFWRAVGSGPQYLQATGTGLVEELDVANASGVQLAGPFTAHFVSLAGGSLSLNAFDLTLTGGAFDVSDAHYVNTNSSGSLRQPLSSGGTVTWPVGTAAAGYRPVYLRRGSGSGTYGVRVAPAFGSPGPVLADHGVNLRWYVAAPDATPYDLTVQWLAADELTGFNRTRATVARLNGNGYVASAYGPASTGSPYTLTGAGLPSGGQFAVFDRQSALPVRGAAPAFSLVPYPNPTRGSLSLQASGPVPDGLLLSLFAADGRLVWQQPATPALLSAPLPLGDLATGVYLLRDEAPDGTAATQRVTVSE